MPSPATPPGFSSDDLYGSPHSAGSGTGTGQRPWIVGPGFDLVFLGGASLTGLAAAAVMVVWPASVSAMVWAWLLLFEGPHLLATWQRTMLEPDDRQRWQRLWPAATLALLTGLVFWLLAQLPGQAWLFPAMLGLAALLAWDHTIRQNWGIYSLYAARNGQGARWVRFDKWFLHGFLWFLMLASVLLLPVNQLDAAPWIPAPWQAPLHTLIWLAVALGLGTYAWSLRQRQRQQVPLAAGLYLLAGVLVFFCCIILVMGQFEPLLSQAQGAEQRIVAMTAAGGFVHGLQYLGVVFLANRGRARLQGGPIVTATNPVTSALPGTGTGSTLGTARQTLYRKPWLYYALLALLSVPYLALNAARGMLPGWSLFTPDALPTQLFLAFYWGLFFHHFLMDRYLWRMRGNPRLRQELGLS